MLDLFELVVGRLFADAARVGQQARLRSLRDLDAAALTLRDACVALLGDGEEGKTDDHAPAAAAGHDMRAAVFAAVSRERIVAAVNPGRSPGPARG